MDVRESEADGDVDSGLQQSSVLQQINAIQNMSQEMGEPAPWSSSSSFNSGGSSRWQPPVQASERARRDLKPSSVKSGTRIAHKIAKASIQELLLARSAMDMEENDGELLLDTSASEAIFSKIMSRNKENECVEERKEEDNEDHLETESVISMLSDTTNGTRTLAFSNLKESLSRASLRLDFEEEGGDGGEEVADESDDGEDALSVISALANSISKDLGLPLPSTWQSTSMTLAAPFKPVPRSQTPPPTMFRVNDSSSSPLAYYFLKLRVSATNRMKLRLNIRAWHVHVRSTAKSKNLGYNFGLYYVQHLLRVCFAALHRQVQLRKWDALRASKVARLLASRASRVTFNGWLSLYSSTVKRNLINKTMRRWRFHLTLDAFKRWKITSIIISGWMLHLSFRKWYKHLITFKRFKAKWLGRKRVRLKANTIKMLRGNVQARRKIFNNAGEAFRSYRTKVVHTYFERYKLRVKGLMVREMSETTLKARVITNLKVKHQVESVRRKWTKIRGFKAWCRLKLFSDVVNVFRRFYTAHMVRNIIRCWRDDASVSIEARTFEVVLQRKLLRRCFRAWLKIHVRSCEVKSISEGFKKVRRSRILRAHFDELLQHRDSRREKNEYAARGLAHHKNNCQTAVIDKLLINRMKRKSHKLNQQRGDVHYCNVAIRKYFAKFTSSIAMTILSRKRLDLGERYYERRMKKLSVERLVVVTLNIVRMRECRTIADSHSREKWAGVGLGALYENMEREICGRELRSGIQEIRTKRNGRISLICFGAWKSYADESKSCEEVKRLRENGIIGRAFAKYKIAHEQKLRERKKFEVSDRYREHWALRKCIMKWSVQSLRRSAGYQIADRFKAKRFIAQWASWKDDRAKVSTLVWRGDRLWQRKSELGFFVNLANMVYERKRLDALRDLWGQRRGPGQCESKTIFFWKWLKYGKERKWIRKKIEGAVVHWKEKLMRGGVDAWRYRVVNYHRFRRSIFNRWKMHIKNTRVKIGLFRKRLRMRRFFKRSRSAVAWSKKKGEAEKWRKLRVMRLAFGTLVLWREGAKEKVKRQVEMKRALGRKVKIEGLKLTLAEAHWRRKMVAAILRGWVDWRGREEAKVDRFLVLLRLKRCFRKWLELEVKGRRERWVSKMVAERRGAEERAKGRDGEEGCETASEVKMLDGEESYASSMISEVSSITPEKERGSERTRSMSGSSRMFSPTLEKGRSYNNNK
ncbi:hypothetical protein TrVE_jg697 [Triparma verrucosa]|uniref:Sfi1 spindle body domain-containing protein n=1 Tax=Triparma verrucosa TaxID=1606542 RepID=A0A9W6ZGZ0_9STRA|nr:hypothetical protein TrVE_jg697 [Triparma verrucosa]